ncbi:NPP1 domain-containing protein [Colletotrichum scovillei]|uniref:NPP1 domain-containing protein n=1 Tax=Colletotrichum scovillei TaxID=1209932 RepID=A0A9P7UCM4_9PEZI|nr:NPP1 domain-containing protein [Colletotrichum scovillei]KAF4774738.1 NPP1 domain-containing protein [Colletotrichum scovillei]KAG7042622.1 NPP1 domain-containing protein [Colletotrichum scovillei]KAG7043212.1 NPP1 domain-containing protein [Colletotrichum scovillei]KAG7062659.1 NPP1 domain-containing protein [Colletotrichum scovillei]
MFVRAQHLLTVCLLFSEAALAAILPRGGDDSGGHPWANHDMITPFKQDSSPGTDGRLERRFNPFLAVTGGCDPYPAVDASGALGAGLKPTGGGRSGCGNGGAGQVYARHGSSHGRDAIIYSYYFPKVRWGKGNDEGHRHYWASVVVWINRWGCNAEKPSSYRVVGISYTVDHLRWGTTAVGDLKFRTSPTNPIVSIHDNAMAPFQDTDVSAASNRTLIAWSSLPSPARRALTDVKYEKTQVPFNDANIQGSLDGAYQQAFYNGLKDGQDCTKDIPDPDGPDLAPGEQEPIAIPLPPVDD